MKEVDNHLSKLGIGSMVAVLLENYKKCPVIGKVIDMKEKEINIHYWIGSWNKPWKPHMVHGGNGRMNVPWTQWISTKCILLSDFILINNKLTAEQKRYLKGKYLEGAPES